MSIQNLLEQVEITQNKSNWVNREIPFRLFHKSLDLVSLSDREYMMGHLCVWKEMGEMIVVSISPLDDINEGGTESGRSGDELLLSRSYDLQIYNLKAEKVFEGNTSYQDEDVLIKYCSNHFFRVKRSDLKIQKEETEEFMKNYPETYKKEKEEENRRLQESSAWKDLAFDLKNLFKKAKKKIFKL
jgi:hypothetical protein